MFAGLLWFLMMCNQLSAEPTKPEFDINTKLMLCTVKIICKETGSVGTGFLINRPCRGEDIRKASWQGLWVLVTARHVFDQIPSDAAILNLRKLEANGEWTIIPVTVRVKNNHVPLYTVNPDPSVDIAVMYLHDKISQDDACKLQNMGAIEYQLLADDEGYKNLKLHPGSTVYCLGYPFGLSSQNGDFPLLRGGTIASYPLLPLHKQKWFYFDFEIFGGNSGGPVYYYEPGFQSAPNILFTLQKSTSQAIIGLVSSQDMANTAYMTPVGQGTLQ